MRDYQIYCSECGCELGIDEVRYMADRAFCNDCLNELTVCCFECGTRMFCDESVGGDPDRPVCESCYDDYYTNCVECGRMIHQENAYYAVCRLEKVALCSIILKMQFNALVFKSIQ